MVLPQPVINILKDAVIEQKRAQQFLFGLKVLGQLPAQTLSQGKGGNLTIAHILFGIGIRHSITVAKKRGH